MNVDIDQYQVGYSDELITDKLWVQHIFATRVTIRLYIEKNRFCVCGRGEIENVGIGNVAGFVYLSIQPT